MTSLITEKMEQDVVAAPVRRRFGALYVATLFVLLLFLPFGAHFLLGLGFSTVLSQSMQPSFSAGDLEITRMHPASNIALNDVVVLRDPVVNVNYSHRVVKIAQDGSDIIVTTKGDANPAADRNSAVLASNLEVPVVAATVPFLGWGIVYLASPDGRTLGFVLLAIAATLFLLRWAYRTVVNLKKTKGTT